MRINEVAFEAAAQRKHVRSGAELARRAGISVASACTIRRGETVKLEIMQKAARALGVTVAQICAKDKDGRVID